VLTIIESGTRAWALAATNGDLRIYSREQAGDWSEVALSEDSEQIDQDGSLILEALYEQRAGTLGDGAAEEPEAEEESDVEDDEPEAEEEAFEEDEEEPVPEDDEEPEVEDEEESEEEEERPRRAPATPRARKK
jgi:hypothetical protein